MRLIQTIKEVGATGCILLWLLGIPIPILLLINRLSPAAQEHWMNFRHRVIFRSPSPV
jgi:hypothetical protein